MKTYYENKHLVNSRHELLKTRHNIQGDISTLYFKVKVRFVNEFEIESKYHLEYCVLFLTAHILSLQDVYFRSSNFIPIYIYHFGEEFKCVRGALTCN